MTVSTSSRIEGLTLRASASCWAQFAACCSACASTVAVSRALPLAAISSSCRASTTLFRLRRSLARCSSACVECFLHTPVPLALETLWS